MSVAVVVVMAAVMVVNVVVGSVKWLSGCRWLPVVVWVESCLWLSVTAWAEWLLVVASGWLGGVVAGGCLWLIGSSGSPWLPVLAWGERLPVVESFKHSLQVLFCCTYA